MWSLKLFKVYEILRVATFDIICVSKFATNCVDYSLPTPFRYSICLLLSNGKFYIAKTLNIWINFFEKIKLWTPHVPFLVSPKFLFTLNIFAFGSLFVGFLLFPSSVYSMAPTFEVVAICAWFVSIPSIKFTMMIGSARGGGISGNCKPLSIYKNFWHFQIEFLKLLSFEQPPWRNMIHINILDVCRVWKLLFNIAYQMEKTFVHVTSLTSTTFSIGFFATNSAIALPHVFQLLYL